MKLIIVTIVIKIIIKLYKFKKSKIVYRKMNNKIIKILIK